MATLTTKFEVENLALLDHGLFETICERNGCFSSIPDFLVGELFGPKESLFKDTILVKGRDLTPRTYWLNVDKMRELVDPEDENGGVALSLLFNLKPQKRDDNSTDLTVYIYRLFLDSENNTKLTLSNLAGRSIILHDKNMIQIS